MDINEQRIGSVFVDRIIVTVGKVFPESFDVLRYIPLVCFFSGDGIYAQAFHERCTYIVHQSGPGSDGPWVLCSNGRTYVAIVLRFIAD
jgi:hypothetical protein